MNHPRPFRHRLFVQALDDSNVSAAASRHVALLFGPAILLVALLRLLQFSLIPTGGRMPLDSLLLGTAPPLFFIVVIVLVLTGFARVTWPHVRPVWIVVGAMVLATTLLSLAPAVLPPWITGWIAPKTLAAVRGDVFVLVVLALVSLIALERLDGRARRCYLAALHLLIPVLLWLPILELGTILALGAAPEWTMLVYSAMHVGELAPVLASEIGLGQAALLLVPLGVTLLPFGLRAEATVEASIPRPIWQPVVTCLPLLVVLAWPSSNPVTAEFRTISYVGMVRNMVETAAYEPEGLDALAATAGAPFDTEDARFAATDSTRRMNVVVILLESFRSRSLTPYDSTLTTTPFLDSLAQHSLLVDEMYAIVPYTNKSITPILAGIYPDPSFHIVAADLETLPGPGLPSLLRPFGYRSAFFTPAALGFERKNRILGHLGFDAMFGDGAYPTDGFHKTHYFGYEDRIVLKPSMAWVDNAVAAGEPFFLTYLTLTAHHDYQTPPGFTRVQYPVYDDELNDYLNTIRYTDDFLRDLFAAYEARGLLESTLFILLGDHGEAFGEHGLRTHGDIIWDEALHIPALLFNPLLFPEGRRVEGPRLYLDVLPTVADALGFSIEDAAYPGYSLLQPVPEDRVLYHHTKSNNKALVLRQNGLKYVYHHRRRPMEVYDLRADPLERHDIANRIPPEQLQAIEMQILLWRRGVQERWSHAATTTASLATR